MNFFALNVNKVHYFDKTHHKSNFEILLMSFEASERHLWVLVLTTY